MLTRQKAESYGPWQLLPPVKQLTPLWVQVPHQGEVSATLYAAEAQSWQSDWQVWSVGDGVGVNVGLVVGLMVGRGVEAAGLAPGTQSSSMRSDAKAKPASPMPSQSASAAGTEAVKCMPPSRRDREQSSESCVMFAHVSWTSLSTTLSAQISAGLIIPMRIRYLPRHPGTRAT